MIRAPVAFAPVTALPAAPAGPARRARGATAPCPAMVVAAPTPSTRRRGTRPLQKFASPAKNPVPEPTPTPPKQDTNTTTSDGESTGAAPRAAAPAPARRTTANPDGGLMPYLQEIGSVDLLSGAEVSESAAHVRNLLRWEEVRQKIADARAPPPPAHDEPEPSAAAAAAAVAAATRSRMGSRTLPAPTAADPVSASSSSSSASSLADPAPEPRARRSRAARAAATAAAAAADAPAEFAKRYRSKTRAVIAARAQVGAVSLDDWAEAVGMEPKRFARELALARAHKDRLVSANLRLVVSIAKKYAHHGVALADLIQEGSLGLIRGAEKFDHTKGFRFATYVSWWIRQAVQRAICDAGRTIRLPTHVNDTARKAVRVRRDLEVELGREPSTHELAVRMGVKADRLSFVLNKAAQTDTVSLDVPLFNNGPGDQSRSVSLGDMIENPTATPEETVSAGLLRDDIENVLLMLSPREREVLRMRYGFDDGCGKNFEEIGAIYCVPPNRIRQIEARAIRKLRHPNFNRCLTDWRGF